MLPEKDSLPSPKPETGSDHGDRKAGCGQRGLDMGGHIIGTFRSMGEDGVIFLDQAIQPILQVPTGSRIGVLLNDQTGRGVLHHHRAQSLIDTRVAHRGLDLRGDLVESLAVRSYRDPLHHG